MNYRMPAEWHPHDATWLSWPKNKITWPGKMLSQVESIYIQMMQGLLPGEKVHLLVDDDKTAKKVFSLLSNKKTKTSNLIFHRCKTVDTWIRDYGPIFVLGSDIRFTKWIFNGWGGKYADLATDTQVVDRLIYLKAFSRTTIPMILEGGSIDVNGEGICLTTEQCLLNKNRNRKLSKTQIENNLKKYLGLKKIIWLKEGIEADDTDGHVDDITRFAAPNVILTAVEHDSSDKNHHYLKENLDILRSERNLQGKKFDIRQLPMPGRVGPARTDTTHDRLPASYANFYIGNHAVLVPIYSHSNDKKALRMIREAFPTRKVVGIECSALVYGLGSIHCVTQQQPSAS